LSTAGPLVSDPLGTGDAGAVTEPLGVADGVTDGDRDGVGTDRLGLGVTVGVTVGVALGVTAGCTVAAGPGTGRTRMYSARMARNRPEMIRVEVRGRPLTRHLRWTGRYRGRRRR
jgi:hypothetical protein